MHNNFALLAHRQVAASNIKRHFVTQNIQRLGIASLLAAHTGCVNTVSWNEQGTRLVSGGDDCSLKIWNQPTCAQSKPLSIATNHTGNIFCALFVPQTQDANLLSCAADSDIGYYDVHKKKCLSTIREHTGMVHKLAVFENDPFVFLSCSRDGTCREFDLRQHSKDHIVHVDLRAPEYEIFGLLIH